MQLAWPDDADPRIQVLGFLDLSFAYLGRHLALCRLPCAPAASSASWLEAAPSWRLLRPGAGFSSEPPDRLLQHADICRLRTLLAGHEYCVHRLDDRRVRSAVSQLIQRGTLGLFERIEVDGAMVRPITASPAPPAAQVASPAKPRESSAREPAVATTSRGNPALKSIPNVLAVEATDPIQALDQDAQAAVLVRAARNGAPFCEECARRAAALAQPIAA